MPDYLQQVAAAAPKAEQMSAQRVAAQHLLHLEGQARKALPHGISGAKGLDDRPAFDILCKDAARRQFDMVMAWSVDRLVRSLQDLVGFLSELHALKIDLVLHQQGLDTTTLSGRAMFQMLGVSAEFERSIIRERVNSGLARAVASGKTLARPRTDKATEAAIRAALKAGDAGMHKIAAAFGVGTGTVQRIKAEMAV
jgi:DNA invertase Pin-like site-specific DNA recombinase